MLVKLKTLLAGPDGVLTAGTIADLPNGAELVAGGYADAMNQSAPVESVPVEAAIEPVAEQATAPPQRTRRKGA